MQPPAPDRQAAATDAVEELIRRFEDAWESGSTPDLASFLAERTPRRFLEELVKVDLDFRWRREHNSDTRPTATDASGLPNRPRLEDYIQRYPQLGPASELPAALIVAEYEVRHYWGDHPGHAEYQARFPSQGPELQEALRRTDDRLARERSSASRWQPSTITAASQAGRSPASENGREKTVAAAPSASELLDTLRGCRLLAADQLDELVRGLDGRISEAREVASALRARTWLTPYQIDQLCRGRGHELRLGRYVVLERLGEGGAGQVFKAWDQTMARVVALKTIRQDLLAEPEIIQRFYREMEVVGRLTHPNIVHAYDAGPVGELQVLVMEYVDGTDLARLVREAGPLPVGTALEYTRQAALGLQYVHEQGLVHRDIKPANLLVAEVFSKLPVTSSQFPEVISLPAGNWEPATGNWQLGTGNWQLIKILDLGLARFQRRTEGELTNILTPQGAALIGTPDYLAPEQAIDFHQADIRADIYSLGCTLYYMLAGRPPFPGGTLGEKLAKQIHAQPVPVEQLRDDIPPGLRPVLQWMLAKRPEQRFQTPGEVVTAIGALASTGDAGLPPLQSAEPISNLSHSRTAVVPMDGLPASPGRAATGVAASKRSFRRRLLLRIGSPFLLAVVAVAFTLVALLHESSSSLPATASVPALPAPAQAKPAVLPLWQAPELVKVLGEQRWRCWGPVRAVVFDRQGNLITAGDDGILRRWDIATRVVRETYEGHQAKVLVLALAPEGRWLLSGSQDGCLKLWDLSSGQVWTARQAHAKAVAAVAFAPGGERFASAALDGTVQLWHLSGCKEDGTLVAKRPPLEVPADDPGKKGLLALTFLDSAASFVTGGEDGSVRQWQVPIDERNWKTLETVPGSPVTALAFTASGSLIIGRQPARFVPRYDVNIRNLATGTVQELSFENRKVQALAVSPDGRALAIAGQQFVVYRDLTESDDRVIAPTEIPYALAFAPDGKSIVYGVTGSAVLRDLNDRKDATNQETYLDGGVAPIMGVAFTPDSKTLFSVHGGMQRPDLLPFAEIKEWDLGGERARPKDLIARTSTAAGVWKVTFAADASEVALGGWGGRVQVWRLRPQASDKPVLSEPAPYLSAVAFAPKGTVLAKANNHLVNIWPADNGLAEERPEFDDTVHVSALAFAADGLSLAIGRNDGTALLWDRQTQQIQVARGQRAPRLSRVALFGETLVTAQDYGHIALWSTAPLAFRKALERLDGDIQVIRFSRNGKRFAAPTLRGNLAVWDAATGTLQHRWSLPGPIHDTAFSPDGTHLATANANGTVYILRLGQPTASR
jgi:serine/threonine protein kinase/WD40 repeat protein